MTADPVRSSRPGRRQAQDIDRHVGAMIRARRALLGLTQRQLADQIGVSFQQICKYESGRNQLTAGLLYHIAQALSVEADHFFHGLGAEQSFQPTAQQRPLLELARHFISMPSRHQETLCKLARTLADEELVTATEAAGRGAPAKGSARRPAAHPLLP